MVITDKQKYFFFLSENDTEEWGQFSTNLQIINYIEISRCVFLKDAIMILFHVGVSEVAYGALIYCKSATKSDRL